MDVILTNLSWMLFNVILALIPIFFGIIMYKVKNIFVKIAAASVWFFFLPNTIYLTTDIIHFPEDMTRISGFYLFIDLLLYIALIIIGIVTFIIAIDPFEKMLLNRKSKKQKRDHMPFIYALNFFVGFGLVLGRIHRLNSWEVFTDTFKVIYYSIETLKSWQLMVLVIVFAIF